MTTPSDPKGVLREEMKRTLAAVCPADSAAWSAAIIAHLVRTEPWARSRRVMAFAALPGEPDLRALWDSPIRGGRDLCLPRTRWADRTMEPVPVSEWDGQTEPGRHGLREPRAGLAAVPPGEIDLVLVPGLAFDARGRRLGRGAGFYDRLLARADAVGVVRVGVCFDCQLVPAVPAEGHDAAMDAVLTQRGLAPARRGQG